MRIGERGIQLIQKFEGCRLEAYLPTPTDKWSIGFGHTGPEVVEGLVWNQDQADEALFNDIEWVEACIDENVTVPLIQPERDALGSFIFNLGCTNFRKSTLLVKINQLAMDEAAQEFLRWNKQGKDVLPGLTARRAAEKELFERSA